MSMKLPLSASGSWRRGLRLLPGACMPFLAEPLPVDGPPLGESPFEEPRLEGASLEAEAFLLAVDGADSLLLRFMGGGCPRTVPLSTFPDRGPTGGQPDRRRSPGRAVQTPHPLPGAARQGARNKLLLSGFGRVPYLLSWLLRVGLAIQGGRTHPFGWVGGLIASPRRQSGFLQNRPIPHAWCILETTTSHALDTI